MPDIGVVDKVAARLSMDISPAQQALLQLTADIKKFAADSAVAIDAGGQSKLMAQEKINQKLQQSQELHETKLRQIQADGDLSRVMAANMANQQLIQQAEDAALKRELAQKQSDQRMELEQQRNTQKMLQSQQLFEERMNQLQEKGSGTGSGLSSIPGVSSVMSMTKDLAAGMAIFAVVNELAKIPQTIEDVSASMTKLKQVLELSDQIHGVDQLNDSLSQLQSVAERQAVLYGQNVSTVLDVMTQAGRRFKDIPSIIVATDNALQAMVADNVDAEKAIKGEEAMMAQFGLTLGETRDTWAKLTVASHEFLTDASGIIDAVERSGSSFNGMKVNTDGAIAAIVSLAQESGRTGSVVGNTWKSLESTLASKKGVEALQQLGIEAKTANGTLVDGVTILGQLQAKWPQLSEASRQAFASILAGGKYQVNQLITFLDDTSGTYVKALDAMKKANQDTQRELVESAMQSLPTQLKMTTASMQVMTDQFSKSLTPALIEFYTEIRNSTKFIGDHAQVIEKLIGLGMTLAEGYVAWRVGLSLYNAVVDSATVKQIQLNSALYSSQLTAAGASKGFATLQGSIMAVGVAAAQTVAKMAILIGVTEMFNNIAARNADPLGEKQKDLQAELDSLEQKKQDEQQYGTGIIGGIVQGWDFFKEAGANILNPQRAGAIGDAYSNDTDAQIASVKKQLADVQKQREDQQNADFEKYQKMVDDAVKQADNIHLPPPPMDNGPENITPDFSKPSAASYTQPFTDSVKSMEDGLGPLNNITKSLDGIIGSLTTRQDNLSTSLKYGSSNMNLASDAAQIYLQRLDAYKTHQDSLHATNEQIRSDMAKIAAQMQAINPTGADPTTLSQGQQDALSKLSQEYDKLSSQLDQNSQKWQQDAQAMIQATDDWANSLKQLQANQLAPFDRQLKDIENQMKSTQAAMSMDKSKMNHGDTSLATTTDYTKQYLDQLSELQQKEQTLTQERAMHAKQLNDLQYAYNDLDKNSDGYAAAAQNLTEQIDAQKSAMADLDDQIAQTSTSIQSLKDSYEQLIEDGLKKAYEAEQKLQDQQLQDAYDAKTKAIQDQIDAVDALVQSLERQWSVQDANNKLADLEKQDADVRSQLDHVIIGTDGKATRTYDTQKDADFQKQIADQKTQIARDQQKQQLEDQKAALEKQLQAVKDEYNKEKAQLDAYWAYKLSQDQLKQDADNEILKNGLLGDKGALSIVDSFAAQAIAQFNAVQSAAIAAGQAISQTLGLQSASQTPTATLNSSVATPTTSIPKFAVGGVVPNVGSGGVDTVLTRLTPGEIVAPSFADIKNLALDAVKQSTSMTTIQKGQNTFQVTVYADDSNSVMRFLDLVHSV